MNYILKTFFVALCLTFFGITHAQILPDAGYMGGGDSFAEVTPAMIENTDIGHISTIACGASFTRYSICLKWNSLDTNKSPSCFKTNEAALNLSLLSLKETKKMAWATFPTLHQGRQFGYLSYADEEPKDWEVKDERKTGFSTASNSTKTYKGNWRRVANTISINCPEENKPKKYVGDSLDYLGEVKPVSIGKGLEDCLLAERKLRTDGTTYYYDRSRFICLSAENESQAEMQLAKYLKSMMDYDGFNYSKKQHLKKQQERDPKIIYLTLGKNQISNSNICAAQIRAQVISANEIDEFYTDINYKREIGANLAALTFVVREKDCTELD